MVALNLTEGQIIEINGNKYSVKNTITRDVMKNHEERVEYYTYELSSENKDITHAALDYMNNDAFVFHLTKKVNADISPDFIEIDSVKYSIDKIRDEVYIDPMDGDLKEAKCYNVSSEKTGIVPSELHIHGENNQIFYLNMNLKKGDILIHDKE